MLELQRCSACKGRTVSGGVSWSVLGVGGLFVQKLSLVMRSWGRAHAHALLSCHWQEEVRCVLNNNVPLSSMRRHGWTNGLYTSWTGLLCSEAWFQPRRFFCRSRTFINSAGGWVRDLGVSMMSVTFLNVKSSFLVFFNPQVSPVWTEQTVPELQFSSALLQSNTRQHWRYAHLSPRLRTTSITLLRLSFK